jgi:uncharacterized protein YbbC (DUF1343 family)
MATVQTGIERFIKNPPQWIKGKRIGLLCNPASIDSDFRHSRFLIDGQIPAELAALYSPQHGFFAEKQDNMIESRNMRDPVLGIPVYSLYGDTREPAENMLEPIDILIIDLQDVGTRVYTFIYTVSYCLEAARNFNKKVLLLDRPNPINGTDIEGNCLRTECASFVGRYPLPMRHGLTIGELALLINDHYKIGCELDVIPMAGWHRKMFFTDTGLPWVPPSPNLPTPTSALVYPGQVLWEGTNVSEGRGTSQPFELFGAPYLEIENILKKVCADSLPGVILRPTVFEPTSNKWQREPCTGFQIHVTDPVNYTPYLTSLKLLQAIMACHPQQFEWRPPPYEYEFERLHIDLIIGDRRVRRQIENMEPIEKIQASWQEELDSFKAVSREYHLYK